MPVWSISSRCSSSSSWAFNTPGVTGSGLVHLQGLANLAWLDLSYTRIGDPELKQLAKLSQLKAVGLYGTPRLSLRHPQDPGGAA